MPFRDTAEHRRLQDSEERRADWKDWGPYVAERAWGTVREDYSATGEAWDYFPHDHARSRAYRWNEDGIGGICNRFQNLCLTHAFWNENDPILKERLFGLTGSEGNHGEDVKELYYYLDSTPTHSYMKMLYVYPHATYPYQALLEANRNSGVHGPEIELWDLLAEELREERYFEITIEYAKVSEDDLLCRITAVNCGPDAAPLHILPQLCYRNTWSWDRRREPPLLERRSTEQVYAEHHYLGERYFYVHAPDFAPPRLLFCDNETNFERLYGTPNTTRFPKDAINDAVVRREPHLAREDTGTKAAAHFSGLLPRGMAAQVWLRLAPTPQREPFQQFEETFTTRIREADEYYDAVQHRSLDPEQRTVQRQALAGLLWSKQFYHFGVDHWLHGDPAQPEPPEERLAGRNRDWTHVYALDVISMPDKWEYPWFAAWDLAFHVVPLSLVDPEWAKRQLILLLREWYMHPNGQIPAYEWAFSDVNPPVHAWSALQVYRLTKNGDGSGDLDFLERIFHKLLMNFTWWVNRKDIEGNNIFQGGFLGLDNIGVFDRSKPLPTGGHLDQADGTAWMAIYCLQLLAIALELAPTHPAYEDVATKFFEHFIYIADAFYTRLGRGASLWNEADGFFYDLLHHDGRITPLKIRSLVGLMPLIAALPIESATLERLPRFKRRMQWFIRYRPRLVEGIASLTRPGQDGRLLLALAPEEKLLRILQRMFNSAEFLSDFGIRALSKEHEAQPYRFSVDGVAHEVRYEPAESSSSLFGGNSNWRGPIWFPINYLLVEALEAYHYYYGDELRVEYPTGSGQRKTLAAIAADLAGRLCSIFSDREGDGRRPVFGGQRLFEREEWRDRLLFYEYFHGDSGAGVGASHQTGWTALVASLLQRYPRRAITHV